MSGRNDLKGEDLLPCMKFDPNMFAAKTKHLALAAAEVCSSCPHRRQCLENGEFGKESGTWGGVLLSKGKRVTRYQRTPSSSTRKRALRPRT